MEKKKLVLSFSGGRTSAFMTQYCLNNLQDEYEMVVVYANTGEEHEKTLEFVDKCDKHFGFNLVWVEAVVNPVYGEGIRAKIVNFETASRKGEPFEAIIAKYGIPSQKAPFCSKYLKKYPINSYLKEQLGWKDFYTAIGIRADEPKRLDWERAAREKAIYPLATMLRTTKSNINSYWRGMLFDLELKSYEGNCKWCWKKSQRVLMTLAIDHPSFFDFPRLMQTKYENFVPINRAGNENLKPPFRFFRHSTTVEEIFEESKFPFKKAEDESKKIQAQKELWSDWDEHLDGNFGCVESCEAF